MPEQSPTTATSYAARLRQALNRAGKNLSEVAREIGATPQALQHLADPKKNAAGSKHTAAIAGVLGVGAEWLASGQGDMLALSGRSPMVEIDLESHPDVQAIPTVTLRLRAGIQGFSVDGNADLGMPIFVPTEWMRRRGYKPEQLLGLPVYGDSMEPTLSAGDKILINTFSMEPKDGKIFAINYEGEPIIKRLHRDHGQWWLSSDNSDQRKYPRKLCADAGCLLLGELVFRQSDNF